jgi:hypothetical protein
VGTGLYLDDMHATLDSIDRQMSRNVTANCRTSSASTGLSRQNQISRPRYSQL